MSQVTEPTFPHDGIEPTSAGCAQRWEDVEDGTCNPCTGAKTATETIAEILDNAGFHFRASSPPPAEKAHEAGGRTKVGRPRLARPLSADYPVNNQFVLGCSTAPRSHPSKVTEALHALFGRRRRCPRPQIEGLHRCPRASWFCILSVLRDLWSAVRQRCWLEQPAACERRRDSRRGPSLNQHRTRVPGVAECGGSKKSKRHQP